ncbi:hypothetical protein C7441_12157 [Pseudaminobacter salicylatoxidans]|uniref:Uncharacterized protein n=1 Tax=Pseudaminobacter salicylatoxidans TaxID=93369 RepID=A0A316BP27_PSESE|nr:hypothetical protein [Pseudaminobacter salicylatoxidans]PWJ75274.1 hypothetical protein C7441_12157 [Pseudaminobacter salicylatoxidans]
MARNAGEIVIDGRELMSSLTVSIRMSRMFGVRIWIATRLFELAGLVTGWNVVVEIEGDEE